MFGKNKLTIGGVVMVQIKGVQDGREPHEVLYDIVLHAPKNVYFHVGKLVSFETGLKARIKSFLQTLHDEKNDGMVFNNHGGELLTRCNKDLLPQRYIGEAFSRMPVGRMQEMFPVLLEQQLKHVEKLSADNGRKFFSVNLEGMDNDKEAWEGVCDLLYQYRHLSVNVELKENEQLCPEVMAMVARMCTETDIGIYVDDLCACFHELPQSEEYVVILIEQLHQFIKAVKVDYEQMKQIMTIAGYNSVQKHLNHFELLWRANCRKSLPLVVFESMPIREPNWLVYLERLASEYKGCQYQTG
jgi:hypothetical protein